MDNDTRGVRWAKLAGNYWEDEAIEKLNPASELMYVRGLALCAARLTDGHISRAALSLVGRDMVKRWSNAGRLVDVGLWVPDGDDDGWTVRNYLRWNRSAEDISAAYERDRQRKRSKRVRAVRPESERTDESTSARNPNGFQRTETETEQPPPTPPGSVGGGWADAAAAGDGAAATPADVVRRVASTPPDLTPLRQQLEDARRKARDKIKSKAIRIDAEQPATGGGPA